MIAFSPLIVPPVPTTLMSPRPAALNTSAAAAPELSSCAKTPDQVVAVGGEEGLRHVLGLHRIPVGRLRAEDLDLRLELGQPVLQPLGAQERRALAGRAFDDGDAALAAQCLVEKFRCDHALHVVIRTGVTGEQRLARFGRFVGNREDRECPRHAPSSAQG